jgi:hypothetical protein
MHAIEEGSNERSDIGEQHINPNVFRIATPLS